MNPYFFFTFSPCAGLVVSGYSKNPIDKSWNTITAQSFDAYKNFKRMYVVDNSSSDFNGISKNELPKLIHYINPLLL